MNTAFTYVYNEADIVEESVAHMVTQGFRVYVLDNWSTDDTWQRVVRLTNQYQGLVELERYPLDTEPTGFDLGGIMRRIEVLCQRLRIDWGLLFGCDELFEAPGTETVAEYLRRVARLGYNAVMCKSVEFRPVDDTWQPEMGLKAHFEYWEPGKANNLRIWRTRGPIALDSHNVEFEGRRIWEGGKVIIRHYPYRSQAQAERRVFQNRQPRYLPENLAKGWHHHVAGIQPGQRFIWEPETLQRGEPWKA